MVRKHRNRIVEIVKHRYDEDEDRYFDSNITAVRESLASKRVVGCGAVQLCARILHRQKHHCCSLHRKVIQSPSLIHFESFRPRWDSGGCPCISIS